MRSDLDADQKGGDARGRLLAFDAIIGHRRSATGRETPRSKLVAAVRCNRARVALAMR